jgi:hypothetical protein
MRPAALPFAVRMNFSFVPYARGGAVWYLHTDRSSRIRRPSLVESVCSSMKLTLYRATDGRVEIVGTIAAGEVDNPVLSEFPAVSGPDGRELRPADGITYLLAVHEVLRQGTKLWSEVTPPRGSVSTRPGQ